MKGIVFNIQRYAIHDGSGIRTIIFLKGCPLRCPWCCNPESQAMEIEEWETERGKEVVGKWMDVEEVIDEVLRDEMFFRTSGGGVTISGGEMLAQAPFAMEILKELKKLGIHTAIETTGHGSTHFVKKLAPYVDEVLMDLKIMDEIKALTIFKAKVPLILENFAIFKKYSGRVIPRIPLIPTFTMDLENIYKIIEFLAPYDEKEVHLLPFHQYGSKKYSYLKKKYTLEKLLPPSKEEIAQIVQIFEEAGHTVVIEGLS